MRKVSIKYFLSVEGNNEEWYFEWLQGMINSTPTANCMVKFDCKVEKDPLKRAKGLTFLGKAEITHVFDRESEEFVHVEQFITTLNRMKEAESIGKRIKYSLGYSNFAFELWMVLHKSKCYGSLAHRRKYLKPINKAYSEEFDSLDQFKEEDNFKRILGKLSIEDVKQAIDRSKTIMHTNNTNGYVLYEYKGYKYYKENPSLSVFEIVEKVMIDCGLL
jgi:hypothetical protein